MSEPESVTRFIDGMLKSDPSVTSVFVAETPFPKIVWVSLHGHHNPDPVLEHRSEDSQLYQFSIPVAVLTTEVKRYRSRATVTLGMFRHLNAAVEWKTWEVANVQVKENSSTREVTVEFDLRLDGDAVAAGSFNYTVDLYLEVHLHHSEVHLHPSDVP